MNIASLFEQWRITKRPDQSWGLSWFLAYEFCKRFYASHGLVPWVINHDGMGYYGIAISQLPCGVNGMGENILGRFTIGGDVENWRTGGAGDHGCPLMEMCAKGVSTEELVLSSISHFDIPVLPEKTHYNCRHKRWGASYELCFEIATLVALRYEADEIAIWNHPAHTRMGVADDTERHMKEHPGAFLFVSGENSLCVTGDGRILCKGGLNLWHEYMRGKSPTVFSDLIIQKLFNQEEIEYGKADKSI